MLLQTKHMQTHQEIVLHRMQPHLRTNLVVTVLSFPMMETCVQTLSQPGQPSENLRMGMAS